VKLDGCNPCFVRDQAGLSTFYPKARMSRSQAGSPSADVQCGIATKLEADWLYTKPPMCDLYPGWFQKAQNRGWLLHRGGVHNAKFLD